MHPASPADEKSARAGKPGTCKYCQLKLAVASVPRHQKYCEKNEDRVLSGHGCGSCGMRFDRGDSRKRHCDRAQKNGVCPKPRSRSFKSYSRTQPSPASNLIQSPGGGNQWLTPSVSDNHAPSYQGEPSPDWSNRTLRPSQFAQNNQTLQGAPNNLPSAIYYNRQSPDLTFVTGYRGNPQSSPPMNAHGRDPQRLLYTSQAASTPPRGGPFASVHIISTARPAELARDGQAASYHPSPHGWAPNAWSPVTHYGNDYRPQSFRHPRTFSASPPPQAIQPGMESSRHDFEPTNNVLPLQYGSHPGTQCSNTSHWPLPTTLIPQNSNTCQVTPVFPAARPLLGDMSGHSVIPQFYEGTAGQSNGNCYANNIAGELIRSLDRSTPNRDLHHQSYEILSRSFPGGSSQWETTQSPLDAMLFGNPSHLTTPQLDQGVGQPGSDRYVNAIVKEEPTSTSRGGDSVWGGSQGQSPEMLDRNSPGGSFWWQPLLDTVPYDDTGHSTTPQFHQGISRSSSACYGNTIAEEPTPTSGRSTSEWGSHHQSHEMLHGSFPGARSQWETTQPPLHGIAYNNLGHSTPPQFDQGIGQFDTGRAPTPSGSVSEWGGCQDQSPDIGQELLRPRGSIGAAIYIGSSRKSYRSQPVRAPTMGSDTCLYKK